MSEWIHSMGNLPSSRRNSRISQNPSLVPGPRIVAPPPGPAGYPPSAAPHMPYYYPPNYNGAMPAPQYFHQSIPTNGHYLMSLPPPQGFRAPSGSLPPPSNPPRRYLLEHTPRKGLRIRKPSPSRTMSI